VIPLAQATVHDPFNQMCPHFAKSGFPGTFQLMTSTLQLSSISLRVPQLARSIDFYTRQLGFVIAREEPGSAELSTAPGAPPILRLLESPAAPPAPRDAAGLFHAALLLPRRAALGTWLRFAGERGVRFEGFSDHGVSEAIYLSDPDGNGLEFYADRPREAWPFADGELAMTTLPLDLHSLLAESRPATAEPLAGAHWGHLHLRVTDLDRSAAFYQGTLGVAVTQRTYPGARFLAADGYHHHLGLNIWGEPRQPQPSGALGLAGAVFARGDHAAHEVRDPDGIALRLVPLHHS
jgi:catechol 2,3-dioxygenase